MEKQQKNSTTPAKDTFQKEREQRGEHTPAAANQQGATEQQVQPLTPPMATSDQRPNEPQRGKQPDPSIDPAGELTPG